jgi:hypothetical protein
MRCYFLIQAQPGSAAAITEFARRVASVSWADAMTGSYDVLVLAEGERRELAHASAVLRMCEGVDRVLVCTPGYGAPTGVTLEEARALVPR